MNKLMEPYWRKAPNWQDLKLPADLEDYVNEQVFKLSPNREPEHIHIRDFGIRDHYLGYGLRFFKAMCDRYRTLKLSKPLMAYISLDDGSALIDDEMEDGVPFFDCTIHFHIEWDSDLQWMEVSKSSVEATLQPVLIIESDNPLVI